MSNFSYTGSGTIKVGGCSNYRLAEFLYFKFYIGSIVYNKKKAANGIYEMLVIKKIHFPKTYETGATLLCINCDKFPIYTDTLNALWNENELVSYTDAAKLVKAYFESQDLLMKEIALKCLNNCH